MISYFNSAYPVRYLTALLIALVLWLPSFILVGYVPIQESLLSHLEPIGFISAHTHFFIWGSFAITYLSAIAINQILKEYDLVSINNTIGLALFIVFASAIPLFTSVNAMTLANLFLILVIQGILRLSHVENPVNVVFNTSLFLGIASLFFTPVFYLILVIWMALVINRHVDIRNLMISLVGLLLPYLFLFTWFFWNDSLAGHWHETIRQLAEIKLLNITASLGIFDMIVLVLSLLILILAVLRAIGRFGEVSIYTRRNMLITLYYLAVSFLIILFYSGTMLPLMILIPPTAMLVAATAYDKKNKWWSFLFTLYFLLIILNQYSSYIIDVKTFLFR